MTAHFRKDGPAMVIAVMQLPPPLHGMSKANDAIRQRLFTVRRCDVQDLSVRVERGRFKYFLKVFLCYLRVFLKLAVLRFESRTSRRSLYISLSGGERLYLEAALINIARWAGFRAIFCQHHSYAYIDAENWGMRWICSIRSAAVRHIVQTQGMCDAIRNRYANHSQAFDLLGNAWIVDSYMGKGIVRAAFTDRRIPCVGLVSNLSPEKGVLSFLRLVRSCALEQLAVRFELAGPCSAAVLAEIERTVGESDGRLVYTPFVDDAQKNRWFGEVDLFFFASSYFNEANPLVLLEALAAGVFVVSTDKGSIAATLNGAGVIADLDRIEAVTLSLLKDWIAGVRSVSKDSEASLRRFSALKADAERQLENLAREIFLGM